MGTSASLLKAIYKWLPLVNINLLASLAHSCSYILTGSLRLPTELTSLPQFIPYNYNTCQQKTLPTEQGLAARLTLLAATIAHFALAELPIDPHIQFHPPIDHSAP